MDLHANAESAIRMVKEAKEMAYDTETSGLDWKINSPIGYVFTVDSASVYVPIRHAGGGNLSDPSGKCGPMVNADDKIAIHPFETGLAKAFQERANTPNFLTIGHHLKFDCHFSANAGVMLGRNLSCTQNTQTLLNEHTRSYSLESIANSYGVTAKLGEPMYQHLANLFGGAAVKGQMSNFWRTSGTDQMTYDYAAGDGVSTLEVWRKQRSIIEINKMEKIFELENEVIWTLFRMERRGMLLDMPYLDRLVGYLNSEIDTARYALPDKFNPRSPKNMRDLMEGHGHLDWPKTEKGNPSFTADWLKTHDIGKKVVALREWTNLLNTFVLPLRDEHAHEGRVHATLHQNKADDAGTIAGRLSCGTPNMQAVPKHNKPLAAKLRRAFMAEKGMKLSEADWSQAEPRLFAHYSQDTNLMAGYLAVPFRDVHTVVADMLQVDRGTTGKRMNMGMFTGMQIKTFSEHMELPQHEAAELWHKWYTLFPGVRNFQQQAKSVMLSRGYIRTIYGRRGNLDEPRFAYKATSKIIQGSQADMAKYKLVEIDKELERRGDTSWLVMAIHDSFIWQSPVGAEGDATDTWIKNCLEDVMGEPFKLAVPFVVDCESGAHWAEASLGNKAKPHYIDEEERI